MVARVDGGSGRTHQRSSDRWTRLVVIGCVAFALLASLVGVRLLWFRHAYGTLNPLDLPITMTIKNRDVWRYPGEPPQTQAQIATSSPGQMVKVGSVGPVPFSSYKRHDIHAIFSLVDCPQSAYVQLGPDQFVSCSLQGGC